QRTFCFLFHTTGQHQTKNYDNNTRGLHNILAYFSIDTFAVCLVATPEARLFDNLLDCIHLSRRVFSRSSVHNLSVAIENKEIGYILLLEIERLLVRLQVALIKQNVGKQLRINVLGCLPLGCSGRGRIYPGKHWNEVDVNIVGKSREKSPFRFLNELAVYGLKPRIQLSFRLFGVGKTDERVFAPGVIRDDYLFIIDSLRCHLGERFSGYLCPYCRVKGRYKLQGYDCILDHYTLSISVRPS